MQRVILGVFFLCMIIGLRSPSHSSDLDISIGGNYWYNHWDPAWKYGYTSRKNYNPRSENIKWDDWILNEFKARHNMSLFGPALSFRFFNRLTISGVFMYGKTFMKSEGYVRKYVFYPAPFDFNIVPRTFKRKINKWDLDTSVSVQIIHFFSIFCGFKYQGYSYNETEHTWLAGEPGKGKAAIDKRKKINKNMGPGLGVSFNINLWESLFLQLAVSGIVMWGKEKFDSRYGPIQINSVVFVENKDPLLTCDIMPKGKYLACGGTFSAGLAYGFSDIGVTISTGFRYQLLRYYQKVKEQSYDKIGGRFDHFYGLTVSAIYTFSFGS